MHFSIYVVSEIELCVKMHTNKAHFSTVGYYFLMIFLKIAGFRMRPPSTDTFFFIELSKQAGSKSVCET